MSTLLPNGTLTFGDSIYLSTNPLPTGTRWTFYNAAAPTSWTQVTDDTANNRMLRVINSAGGGTGGSASPILNNVVPAHTHGFSTGNVSADHSHSGNTGNVSADHSHYMVDYYFAESNQGNWGWAGENAGHDWDNRGYARGANTAGINANHYHGFTTGGISANHTHSGTTDNGSSQTNWSPRYHDQIICSRAYS